MAVHAAVHDRSLPATGGDPARHGDNPDIRVERDRDRHGAPSADRLRLSPQRGWGMTGKDIFTLDLSVDALDCPRRAVAGEERQEFDPAPLRPDEVAAGTSLSA